MSDQDLPQLISALKQQRDELALKIHLGEAEAKQQWEKVTAQLDDLTKEYEPLKGAVEEAAGNVLDALKLTAEEIGAGFERIRKAL
jgi:chromosome segregation ATPase